VQNTWIKAIANGRFAAWPALTLDNARKYLLKSDAMVKCHMNQIPQNIRFTQPKVMAPMSDPDMVQKDKCRYVHAAVMEISQIYTGLTGKFPTTSHSGNKYILFLYEYDSNNVLSAPMKNRVDKEMVRTFDLLIQSLIVSGLRPSYNAWTMKPLWPSVIISPSRVSITNWHHHTFTAATMLNARFKFSQTILLQGSAQLKKIYPKQL
jgi:hypothetical protein